ETLQVPVPRHYLAGVCDLDEVAESALHAAELHSARAGGIDLRASGRGVIHTTVRADGVQHWVAPARIEHRADARELHRRLEESLAQAHALGRVVVGLAILEFIAHGAESLAILHRVFGGEDVAVTDHFPLALAFLIGHPKGVALAHVEHEVDVPAENLAQPVGGRIVDARRTRRGIQG